MASSDAPLRTRHRLVPPSAPPPGTSVKDCAADGDDSGAPGQRSAMRSNPRRSTSFKSMSIERGVSPDHPHASAATYRRARVCGGGEGCTFLRRAVIFWQSGLCTESVIYKMCVYSCLLGSIANSPFFPSYDHPSLSIIVNPRCMAISSMDSSEDTTNVTAAGVALILLNTSTG